MPKLFVHGAALKCSEGTSPGKLVIVPSYKAGDAGVKEAVNVLKNATLDPLVWDPEGL